MPEARIVKVPGATSGPLVEKLEITAGGEAISFIPISDKAVLASGSPAMLDAATRQILAPASFLPALQVKNKSTLENLAASDYYFVLNASTLMELAKPFIPLLLMQMPEAKVSPVQVEEVLKLLSFGLVGVQTSSISDIQKSSDHVCGSLSLQTF